MHAMNLAIIGCSTMGRIHAGMATQAGFRVVACIDATDAAARQLAREHKAKTYSTLGEAIRKGDVEAVCIATPTPTHKPLILEAAKAGLDIFSEKPLCRTAKDASQAVKACERAGVKLFVGHVVRYFHEFEGMRAQVKSGSIGKAGFVRMFRGGACPAGVGGWFQDFKKSGGVIFDTSIHDLDWLRYTFGEVERIFCQNLMKQKPAPMDYATCTLRLANGMIAQVTGSWAHPTGFRVAVEIAGQKGIIQFDSATPPVRFEPRAAKGAGSGGAIVPASPVEKSPYLLEWEDCANWFMRGKNPRVLPEDAVRAVELAEAALASAKSGQPVHV